MNALILGFLMLLPDSGLGLLPAPVNLSVSSLNFCHVLRWDPGPGTPPGTLYRVIRKKGKKWKPMKNVTTATSTKLKLNPSNEVHYLAVQASHSRSVSPLSSSISFAPFEDTTIDPPKLSLVGCGSCIHVNISLPEADPSSDIRNRDVQTFFSIQFTVLWKRREGKELVYQTNNRSFTLSNLHHSTEYCVQVQPKTNVNKNLKPSAWQCVYTSPMQPSRVPLVAGAVAALIFGIIILTTLIFFLYYTSFICKLKATLPQAIVVLSRGYTMTPERTILDKISISPEMEQQKKSSSHTAMQPANWDGSWKEEDEEEEEDVEEHNYINKPAELSSGQSSSRSSGDRSGQNTSGTSKDSGGGGTEKEEILDTWLEVVHEGVARDDHTAEAAPEGVQGHDTGEEVEEEVWDSSGNVNLLSVTLGALAAYEEEEEEDEEQNAEESLTDLESHDQTTDVLMLPQHLDFTGSRCQGGQDLLSSSLKTCDGETQHEETSEEEEEEEDFSGYMRHS